MKGRSNYDILIDKLDRFTKKYYLNQLLRGSLYFVALTLGLFLIFSLLEHQFYFNRLGRKFIFYSFILISLLSAYKWIIAPLLSYLSIGKRISHDQAAQIIGNHFGNVKDRLLNILQLKRQNTSDQKALIEASIERKTDAIKLVPFRSAIDLGNNKKYLRYALPPFLLLLVLLFAAPSLITESTHRIINNDKEFVKAAPFEFKILNEKLNVLQYEDFKLNVTIEGDVVPDEAFINIDDFQYRLKKESNTNFSYTFKNVQKDANFQIYSGRVKSDETSLKVLPKPNLVNFEVVLDYPNYIGRKDETISNIGDVLVPQGTKIKWSFNALNTDALQIRFGSESKQDAQRSSNDRFDFNKKVMKDALYAIFFSNAFTPKADSVNYSINVTPDQFPTINVEKFQDSLEQNVLYFIGNASDDYGLTSLSFHYTITHEDGSQDPEQSLKLKKPTTRDIQYDHLFDINELNLQPGDQLRFYFEVYDNDGVNGSKSAKTNIMSFEKPTVEEYEEMEEENEEEIKDKLEKALKESKKIKQDLKQMKEKMLQKRELDWQDKKELEKLLERQKQLEEELKKAKEKFDENLKNQEEFTERQEEILDKQEKLEELFEEVMDQETQELMEKIQELMEELNKDEMMEMMEEMEMSDEELEQEMDKLLELYKQLEVEKEIQDQIQKLEELAEKQEELSEKTEKESQSQEDLKKEQEEIQKELKDVEEKLDEIEKKNKELEVPKEMPKDKEEQMDDIQKDMEQSKESLDKQDNKKSSKSQKDAAKKMKQMAGSLQSSMQAGQMEQMAEDIKALRQLLENLVTLSFDQEDLIKALNRTTINTPKYVEMVQSQFKLKDDFRLIQDSLQALSKRNESIESFVTEKSFEVERNIESSIDELEERAVDKAGGHQRTTMKNVNDLALMLSESMEQMQQQMSGMMPGNQQCEKPGGSGDGKKGKSGNIPMDKISQGQKELSEGLQKMGKNGKPSSKEFAKAAAKQAALRKALEDIRNQKQEQGKGGQELQNIIDEMNKNEIDLVNKRLNSQLLQRQQDIVTRLLEAEKADRTREKDNKRKAERTEQKKKDLPPALQEYLRERQSEVELYEQISPSLKPYYKKLVDTYYKSLKSQNGSN